MTFQISREEKIYSINDIEAHLWNKGEKESYIFAKFVSQNKFQIDQTLKYKKMILEKSWKKTWVNIVILK